MNTTSFHHFAARPNTPGPFDIGDAFDAAAALAAKFGCVVRFVFNGKTCLVHPRDKRDIKTRDRFVARFFDPRSGNIVSADKTPDGCYGLTSRIPSPEKK